MSLQNNFKIIYIFTLAIFLTLGFSACDMEFDTNNVDYSEYDIEIVVVDDDAPIFDNNIEGVTVKIKDYEGNWKEAEEKTDGDDIYYEAENVKLVPGQEFEIELSKVGYINRVVTAVADEDPIEETFELEARD